MLTPKMQKCKNAIFYKKTKQFSKLKLGFSKKSLLDPYNPRWLKFAILKIDMASFFSAEGGPI